MNTEPNEGKSKCCHPLEHNFQGHSTRYGHIIWCEKCKMTPEEAREIEDTH